MEESKVNNKDLSKDSKSIVLHEDSARVPIAVESILGGDGVLLHNFLSAAECVDIIKQTEAVGFEDIQASREVRNNLRVQLTLPDLASQLWERAKDCIPSHLLQRTIPKDKEVQLLTYGTAGEWQGCGLNPSFRLCKYEGGGHFGPHTDAFYQRDEDHCSMHTFMVYLNGPPEFSGGDTSFLKSDTELTKLPHPTTGKDIYRAPPSAITSKFTPKQGTAIVFWQKTILHEGSPVLVSGPYYCTNECSWHPVDWLRQDGCKYIMRSDVMFLRKEGSKPSISDEERRANELVKQAQAHEAAGEGDKAWPLYAKAIALYPPIEDAL